MKKYCFTSMLRYVVLLSFATAYSVAGISQEATMPEIYQAPDPDYGPDVNMWNFMKYGDSPVNYYTGTVSVNIPVYTYKDNDFEIPVSLGYASEGYMPNQQTGILGMGWYLNTGGAVTREVRELADDEKKEVYESDYGNSMGTESCFYYGYLTLNKKKWAFDWSNEAENNMGMTAGGDIDLTHIQPSFFYITVDNKKVESKSDIYHFKFGKHSGSFVMTTDSLIVYNASGPNGEYKIKFMGSKIDYIYIWTGDGYRYAFGENQMQDYTEELPTASGSGALSLMGKDKYYNQSWKLIEIMAPNGRKVKYSYYSKWHKVVKPYFYCSGLVVHDYKAKGPREYGNVSGGISNSALYGAYVYKKKVSYLSKITIDSKVEINFSYSLKEPERIKCSSTDKIREVDEEFWQDKLDRISVVRLEDDRPLGRCKMQYAYNGDVSYNKVLFLDKVVTFDGGEYSMRYYDQDSYFPCNGVTGIDHWGYYNGQNVYEPRKLVPALGVDPVSNKEIINDVSREPYFPAARMGALQKIVYPTGGYSEYEYEEHDFSAMVRRNTQSRQVPYLEKNDLTWNSDPTVGKLSEGRYRAGGIRIKKITDYDAKLSSFERKFSYMTADGKSTGQLLQFPRYFVEMYYQRWRNALDYLDYVPVAYSQKNGIGMFMLSMDKTNIEYTCVREIMADSSYIDYHYSNYATNPDGMVVGINVVRPMNVGPVLYPEYATWQVFPPASYQFNRGKLILKELFSKTGEKVAAEKYTYNYIEEPRYIEGMSTHEYYWFMDNLIVGNMQMDTSIKVSYFGNECIGDSTFYSYNKYYQLTSVKKRDSEDRLQATYAQYVTDIPDEEKQPIHDKIRDKNMLGTVTRTYSEVDSYGNKAVVAGDHYLYADYDGLIKLAQRKQVATILPISEEHFSLNDYKFQKAYEKYDQKGNLLRFTGRDSITVHLIWGYDGTQLIAKAESPAALTADTAKNYFYHTSFEDFPSKTSELATAKTGKKVYSYPTLTIYLTGFAPGQYVLEYWSSVDGVNWTKKSGIRTVSTSGAITINMINPGYIDEMRLMPVGTHMTTYTYEPFVGLASKTDYNYNTVKYEYDRYGRVSLVKDTENNPLELYEYNYKH